MRASILVLCLLLGACTVAHAQESTGKFDRVYPFARAGLLFEQDNQTRPVFTLGTGIGLGKTQRTNLSFQYRGIVSAPDQFEVGIGFAFR